MQLSAAEVAKEEAHIHDDKRAGLVVAIGVSLAIACAAVLLRYTSRRVAGITRRADDYFIWVALSSFACLSAASITLVHYGLGQHLILVTNIRAYVITVITAAFLYNFTVLAVKLSILYFYRRIFPQRWFKYCLLVTGGYIVCYTIALEFLTIFQCLPINSQWDPNIQGRCVNFSMVTLSGGIMNIISDLLVLTLPMPLLWGLKLSRSRRLQLMLTFLLGGCACVVTVSRLVFVLQLDGPDITWNNTNTVKVSFVELGIGILSACLPALRPLYARYFHRTGGSGSGSGGRQFYEQRSGDSKAIRLGSVSKKWNDCRGIAGSDDGERLYHQFGTISHARGNREAIHQERMGDNEIVVTSHFTTSTANKSLEQAPEVNPVSPV